MDNANISPHQESRTTNIENLLISSDPNKYWDWLMSWTLPARSLSLVSLLLLISSTLFFVLFPFLLEPLLARRGIPLVLSGLAPLFALLVVYAGRNRPSFSMSGLDFWWHPKIWSIFLLLFSFLMSLMFWTEPLIREYILPLADQWDIPVIKSIQTILDSYLLPLVFANFLATLVLLPRLVRLPPDSPIILYISQLSLLVILLFLVSSLIFLKNVVYPIIEFFDPATLKIITTDVKGHEIKNADIYINNHLIGTTPLDKKWPRGSHTVCVSKAGYLPYQHDKPIILTDRDNKLRAEVAAQLMPTKARIEINTELSGVKVFLDDDYLGTISATSLKTFEVTVGEQVVRTLKLTKNDYLPFEQTLHLSDEPASEACLNDTMTVTRTVNAHLNYPKLELTAKNASGRFSVLIDGIEKYVGALPYELSLPLDTYQVKVKKQGYPLCQYPKIRLDKEKTTLECYWKQIMIQADADSVKINDEFYSSLPVRVKAPIGTQYVVEKQDHASEVTFVPCEFNIAEETDNQVACRWMNRKASRNCYAKSGVESCWFIFHFNRRISRDEVVFVNGKSYGNTANSRFRLPRNQSPPNSYQIEVKRSDERVCQLRLQVKKYGLPTFHHDTSQCNCYYWGGNGANSHFRLGCDQLGMNTK